MTLYTRDIVGKRALTLTIYNDELARVFWQAVNPHTGLGWQKHRDEVYFFGPSAGVRAKCAYNKLLKVSERHTRNII